MNKNIRIWARTGSRKIRYGICLCLCCLTAACDLEDERDLCCTRQTVMEYRYRSGGQDRFSENIKSLRHFLFDGEERFIGELPAGKDLRLQDLSELEAGNYTMVTIGNAGRATSPAIPATGKGMKDFMLKVSEEETVNADPLFYGICTFAPDGKQGGQHFMTELSNVHCRLKVTVKWQNLPPVLTKEPVYRIDLEECATDYELDGKQGYALGEKRFPYSRDWGHCYRMPCSLQNLRLCREFVSLRCLNDRLPTLTVRCRNGAGDYEALTPALDLRKAFRSWGYSPSEVEIQNYRIIITIYLDGHIGMKVELDAGVMDWVDGGSFG